MQKLKENKAITLIALVITIIILIIIAGVSIGIIMQNGGIAEKAKQGAKDYSNASDIEKLALELQEWHMNWMAGDTNKSYLAYMEDKGYTVDIDDETGRTGTIIYNGNVYSVDLNSDKKIELQGPASAETMLKPRITTAELTKNSIKVSVKSTGATSYTYELSTDGTTYATAGTANGNECLFEGLNPSTKYYVKVTVTNGEGTTLEAVKEITTKAPTLVTSITLDKINEIMGRDDTITITATVGPENADNKVVNWTTSDSSKISIESSTDNTVTIKALAATGSENVIITATAADGSGITKNCSIKIMAHNYLTFVNGEDHVTSDTAGVTVESIFSTVYTYGAYGIWHKTGRFETPEYFQWDAQNAFIPSSMTLYSYTGSGYEAPNYIALIADNDPTFANYQILLDETYFEHEIIKGGNNANTYQISTGTSFRYYRLCIIEWDPGQNGGNGSNITGCIIQ